MQQQKWPIIFFFPDDFGLRSSPRHSETVFAKKRYTSIIVAGVVWWLLDTKKIVTKKTRHTCIFLFAKDYRER